MSKLIGYLIAAGITASPLRGQDVAQLQRRVDSTFREAVLAQKAVLDYRAAHPPLLNFSDSIVAYGGRIKVYFDSTFADQIRAGFKEADKHLGELGQALEKSEPVIFSVAPDSLFSTFDQKRLQEMNVRQHFAAYPNTPSKNSVDGDPKSIAYILVRSVSATVTAKAAPQLAQWTNGVIPITADLDEKLDWGSMRLVMVSSPSHLGQSCYFGDVRACRIFLGLDTVADPIHQLFDSVGRRRRVSHEPDKARSFSSVATDRCLGGNDDACVSVLKGIGGVTVLSSPYMRTSVVTHALKLGGARAAERLLTTTGSPAAALAAAAKMPLDSVVADWQRHLDESSAVGSNVPWTIAMSSIVWVGLCVFLALRGSRWR